jgi:hypothetical protein
MTGLRSQRSQQRDRAIEAFTATRGRGSTDNEVAVLVRESRADKLIEISTEEHSGYFETGLINVPASSCGLMSTFSMCVVTPSAGLMPMVRTR